jgi:hypothetical protein
MSLADRAVCAGGANLPQMERGFWDMGLGEGGVSG